MFCNQNLILARSFFIAVGQVWEGKRLSGYYDIVLGNILKLIPEEAFITAGKGIFFLLVTRLQSVISIHIIQERCRCLPGCLQKVPKR